VFRNVGIQNSDAGELPRKHTTYRTRRKFEIKKTAILSEAAETEILLFIQPTYTFNGKVSYTPYVKNGLKCTDYDQTFTKQVAVIIFTYAHLLCNIRYSVRTY
jgi:hypothetical protein